MLRFELDRYTLPDLEPAGIDVHVDFVGYLVLLLDGIRP